jgi:hypothetical protein
MLAARLVQIVVEVRAGRDEAVDVAVQDQVRDHQAQAAGGQRAAIPRKIVTSSSSIFCQMWCAVARLRP